MLVQRFAWVSASNSSECIPRVTGSCDNSMFGFLRNCLISHSGCTFSHSNSSVRGFQFLHVLVSTCYLCLYFKNCSHLSRCEVVLILVLIFIALLTKVLSIFSCSYWRFVYLLWRDIHVNPLPIKKKIEA